MPSLPQPPPPTTASPSPNPLTSHISTSTSTSTSPHSSLLNTATYASISAQLSSRSPTAPQAPSLSILHLIADWASSPDPIDTDDLRTSLCAFNEALWRDLLEERHLENKCAWVGCANQPLAGYAPSIQDDNEEPSQGYRAPARFRLCSSGLFVRSRPSTRPEKELKSFCGRLCWRRSEWVMERCLGKHHLKPEQIVLLDEEMATRDQAKLVHQPERELVQQPTPAVVPEIDLPGLHIIEKEIPPTQDIVAPRPGEEIDFERPLKSKRQSDPGPTTSKTSSSTRPLAPLPLDLAPIIPTTRPVPTDSSSTSTRLTSPPPLPKSGRFQDLSTPLTLLSDPIMVDPTGQEIEWAGVDEEGESELIKQWMEDALEMRREMRRNGELS